MSRRWPGGEGEPDPVERGGDRIGPPLLPLAVIMVAMVAAIVVTALIAAP